MYGVPSTLDLSSFLGATLIQVGLGEHEIQLRFSPERVICIEGDWVLRRSDGTLVDQSAPNGQREAYYLHRVLGQEVTAAAVDAPRSFSLTFANRHRLEIYDSSTEYESFTIQPGDIVV